MKTSKKLAILYGGTSKEFEISKQSALHVYRQFQGQPPNLSNRYFTWELHLVELNRDGFFLISNIDSKKFPNRRAKKKLDENFATPDLQFDGIFFLVHGPPVEDGKLQPYFESLGLPYIGSNHTVSALTFNKYQCSNALKKIPELHFASAALCHQADFKKILDDWKHYPCFIKPNQSGSSLCAGRASNQRSATSLITKGLKLFDEMLLEEWIEGRELTCGVYYSQRKKICALPITEIISKNEFFDYKAKYLGESEEITPARIDSALTERIQKVSKKIFKTLGCAGFTRIDYIVKHDRIYFIEINTIPGFTEKSLFPQQLQNAEIGIVEFVADLISQLTIKPVKQ